MHHQLPASIRTTGRYRHTVVAWRALAVVASFRHATAHAMMMQVEILVNGIPVMREQVDVSADWMQQYSVSNAIWKTLGRPLSVSDNVIVSVSTVITR